MSQLTLDLTPELQYKLVVSTRAKRAALRVEPGRGLIVTIPSRFAKKRVPAFVEQHRGWIEKTLLAQWNDTPEQFRQWPPSQLNLAAVGKTILLDYKHRLGATAGRSNGVLQGVQLSSENIDADANAAPGAGSGSEIWLMESSPDNRSAVASELAQRLKPVAYSRLSQRLAALAHLHGLRYEKLLIRGQKTLWGSYSSSGTLSLNYKLLFLDNPLVDYVLLHELAHTVHLNHSPAFWRLLLELDVDARKHDSMLQNAGRQVPPWLELAR